MSGSDFDVAVVGAGPTGLVLAHLLGGYGVRVVVLEKESAVCAQARAVTIDDESLRTLQSAGVLESILPQIVQGYGVHYYAWTGRLFARIEPQSLEYGFAKRNAFRQQQLVQALSQSLSRHPGVQQLFDHELIAFEQKSDHIALTLSHAGHNRRLSAAYLVACDGGRSSVRQALNIAMSGSSYAQRWLIVDMIGRTSAFRHTRTYCDPARPAIRLPGPDGTVRYEFMLRQGEKAEDALSEDTLRSWIALRESADASLEILRKVVYTFHARVAQTWQEGRVFLAGDAAHLTPPFAGQGMNSGVRDALNLAWKLAWVIHGRARPKLLETYEPERKPHAWALIRMALQIGRFMQPHSRWGAALMQGLLRGICLWPPARDYILHLKFKPKPRYKQGLLVGGEPQQALVPAGQLMIQPRIETAQRRTVLLDEVLGTGFSVLCRQGQELAEDLDFLAAKRIEFVGRDQDFMGSAATPIRDCSGQLEQVLASAQADAVILRPDRHVLAYVRAQPAQGAQPLSTVLKPYWDTTPTEQADDA